MKKTLLKLLEKISPSNVITLNCLELINREQTGIKKYGVTLDDAKLTHEQVLQHLLEEQLDGANYIRKALLTASQSQIDYAMLRKEIESTIRELTRMGSGNRDGSDYKNGILDAKEQLELALIRFDSGKILRDLRA